MFTPVFRKSVNTSRQMSSISVLTWNVWFDNFKREERYNEILNLCSTIGPDVVCLQEVTPFFIRMLKEHELCRLYDVSDHDLTGSTVGSYGVLSLCRRDLKGTFQFHELHTEMDRKLLTTSFSTPHGTVGVGNVHLESLNTRITRRIQLQQCRPILDRFRVSLLCGDFNFDSDRNYTLDDKPLENNALAEVYPNYKDVWLELHTPGSGKTFDTDVNLMLGQRNEHMRYDRIILRNQPIPIPTMASKLLGTPAQSEEPALPTYVPTEIRLLGTRTVGENIDAWYKNATSATDSVADVPPAVESAFATPVKKSRPVFPSDHFGLHAVFTYQ